MNPTNKVQTILLKYFSVKIKIARKMKSNSID
jgi:hypothetical protein